jgi:hypothetical protein
MNKYDRVIQGDRISLFSVKKDISNEEILQMIYKDLSIKLDFVKSLYPHFKHGLFMYDIMFKHFGIEYKPILAINDSIERFKDTFEECMKAFDNGIFNVEHDYFGKGEWPIILFDRVHRETKDEDWISYTIAR